MSGGVADTLETHPKSQPEKMFHLTFRQFSTLAGMLLLSFIGLVSVQDWLFVVFSLPYMFILSKIAFPSLSPRPNGRVFGEKNRALGLYVVFSGVISFLFPVPYILESYLHGNKEGIKAAASHVFLLAGQVFMEGVAFHAGCSLPVFVFVPVFYNSRRIFTLAEWLRTEIYKVGAASGSTSGRMFVGRVLAGLNLAFWCFNLFGFLLPVFLPRAFSAYYSAQKTVN